MKEQKNVVVGLSGGLGNQMFQYAIGRSLSIRLGVPLALDTTWFLGQNERKLALTPLRTQCEFRNSSIFLPTKLHVLISRISRRFFPKIMGLPVWREPHFHYDPNFEKLTSPVFIEGYWQSELYFKGIRPFLLDEFRLREPLPLRSANLLVQIQNCESVCVHVRRGDYLSNSIAARVHGHCSLDYYHVSLAGLLEKLSSPHCFIFSDDPDWVRSSLSLNCPTTVVDVNGPEEAHLDLALMRSCRHFVIANSSLSWWAAWLGDYHKKQVVAPANWFLVKSKDTRDLIPASWEQR